MTKTAAAMRVIEGAPHISMKEVAHRAGCSLSRAYIARKRLADEGNRDGNQNKLDRHAIGDRLYKSGKRLGSINAMMEAIGHDAMEKLLAEVSEDRGLYSIIGEVVNKAVNRG